jgi:mono/diheme cytochrome c family protein
MKQVIVGIFLITVLVSFQTKPKTQQPAKPVAKSTTSPADLKSTLDRGKLVYLQQCLACHQVDGGGVPHLNAPLDGASAVIGKDKQKIIAVVLTGMKGGEIDGETYSNPMASHKELTDQQIADVLTYIRNSWSNKASAVTPAEVKAVRVKIK